jgi:phage/plasmid-associated DNA primase
MSSEIGQALRPGEINLGYIPLDWPLTPLGGNKNPYVDGWQNKPFSLREIEEEIAGGQCKAIGLIGGPVFNLPYGLVWVDVDGPSVHPLIEKITNKSFADALPRTLTICSGKAGRERRLYKIARDKQLHFVRNKYTWTAETKGEKLEILWSRHQGVLMGLHPETEGYFTPDGLGYEWAMNLPEFPECLLNEIITKNVKQGVPAKEVTRMVGPGFVVQAEISLERDMQLAVEAMQALPAEAADDYDIWLTIGQSLHSLDESLLEEWDEWSKQSDKYKEGECHKRWLSFSKGGGRGIGSLFYIAKENGWSPPEDHKVKSVDDQTLDQLAKLPTDTDTQEMETILAVQAAKAGTQKEAAPKTKRKRGRPPLNKTEAEEKESGRNASADVVSEVVMQMYEGNLVFSLKHNQFFMYEREGQGLWSPMSKVEMAGDIRSKLLQVRDEGEIIEGFNTKLINDVNDQLQSALYFKEWYEGSRYLLFTNGVLDIETRELLPFSRELYLTQQQPYAYDSAASCEEIIRWLKYVQRDSWNRTQVLRAWLRATLLGRYEMQKFVEIVGPGKSGKSTYANLAVALVGRKNVYSTDFENLEKNRFEAAGYMGKKLLLFQDADRWGGSVSRLKAITGSDWIRSERKYQNENQEPFQFKGVVIITANEAIQSTDYTSGLARRRLTIPFDRPFTGGPNEQRELIKFNQKGEPEGDFAPLLPGLVNWLLDMTEEEMRSYLMETSKRVEFFKKYEKLQNLRSNPLLDWLEHKVIYDPGVASAIGFTKNAPMGSSNIYDNQNKWLYASYAEFSRQCNTGVMSRSRFEVLLMDILTHQLDLKVFSKRTTRGVRIINIAVRESSPKYEGWPSVVEISSDRLKYKEFYGIDYSAESDVRIENEYEIETDG